MRRPSTAPKPTSNATVPVVERKPARTTSMTSATPIPAARPVSTATMSREKKACRRALMMRTSRTAIATTAIVRSSQTGRSARTSSSMREDSWGQGASTPRRDGPGRVDARGPGRGADPGRAARGPGSGARVTGEARQSGDGQSPSGWSDERCPSAGFSGGAGGSALGGGGLRCRAQLGEELGHLRVGLVAVGDELGGGRLVVVAQQALAVLDALAVRGDGVGEDGRGGQPLPEGVLEGDEAVRVDVQAGLVGDREGAEEAQAEAEGGADDRVDVLRGGDALLDDRGGLLQQRVLEAVQDHAGGVGDLRAL